MEKFAVDLDKVLDDFELDEDENVGSSQFGQLQLDYSSSNESSSVSSSAGGGGALPGSRRGAPTSVCPPPPASLSSSQGGWSEPQHTRLPYHKFPYYSGSSDKVLPAGNFPTRIDNTVDAKSSLVGVESADEAVDASSPDNGKVPGVRSPPDGQNDDQSSAVAHHSQFGGGSLISATQDYHTGGSIGSTVGYQPYFSKANAPFTPLSTATPASSNISSNATNTLLTVKPNETLWPQFSPNNFSPPDSSVSSQSKTGGAGSNIDAMDSFTGARTQDGNVRREAIGASPTDEEPFPLGVTGNFSAPQNSNLKSNISSVPPDVSHSLSSYNQGQVSKELPAPNLVLLNQDNDNIPVSREVPGSALLDIQDSVENVQPDVSGPLGIPSVPREVVGGVLDLVCSRPVDVIASTVNNAGNIPQQRPLDIVTGACANGNADDGGNVSAPERQQVLVGVQHPDVIGRPQVVDDEGNIDQEREQVLAANAGNPPEHLQVEGNAVPEGNGQEGNIGGVNEDRLLPDLMVNNNEELVNPIVAANENLPEPAIVIENALACHTNNEPVLVQESQTCNRIPEVVNIHQTCEAGGIDSSVGASGGGGSTTCDIVESAVGDDRQTSTNDTVQMRQANSPPRDVDLVSSNACSFQATDRVQSSNSDNVAGADGSTPDNLRPNDSSNVDVLIPSVPVAFNPNALVGDDVDLEAELAELEEEQANLQGAYAVDQDCVTPPPIPTVRNQEPTPFSEHDDISQDRPGEALDMEATNESGGVASPAQGVEARAAPALGLDVIGGQIGSSLPPPGTIEDERPIEEADTTHAASGGAQAIGEEDSSGNDVAESTKLESESKDESLGSVAPDCTGEENESPRHQLTTQMSEEFDKSCPGKIASLPSIVCSDSPSSTSVAAQSRAVAASNDNPPPWGQPSPVPAADASCDTTATAALVDESSSSGAVSRLQTPSNTGGPDDHDDPTVDRDSNAEQRVMPSPTRQTPGALVTAVYDDSQSSRRHGDNTVGSSMNVVGSVAPFWVPDDDAANCQECGVKFTLVRRRHHCRACGRVLCAQCCRDRAPLAYMRYREARVCSTCRQIITIAEDEGPDGGPSHSDAAGGDSPHHQLPSSPHSPDPNNPMEYCSRIPPSQQVTSRGGPGSGATPTVMVPVGVLKREDSASGGNGGRSRQGGGKQVIFSDGIRPGGDLTELDRAPSSQPPPPPHRARAGRVAKIMPGTGGGKQARVKGEVSLIPMDGSLPPVLLDRGKGRQPEYQSSSGSGPEQQRLADQMAGDGPPVLFAIHKNLAVVVKLVKLECCVGVSAWSVGSRGLCGVGQEELVLLLEALPGETHPPSDVFAYFYSVYQQANKGNLVSELGHTILTEPEGFLGSRDHGGFLYVRPTFQCLHNLPLPQPPFLFALLIHKWETPWAKVFPLRLLLRLGAEFRYYPCPLVSTRNRKPVFSEIGHTIMNLLVDFRNYAYTIPGIQGLVVHMEDKKTTLYIPRNRYAQVTKALGNSNDHVLALAANFSPQADSHLVTIENDDGQYSTQAINIHNRPRKVTGASFVVFNGALKSNCGLTAKSSIVEDGLMVQITADVMTALREALRAMKDFSISCGITGEPPQEEVLLRWADDDNNFNVGVKSPVDSRALDGVQSVKIHSGTDYVSSEFLIRWTEVFIIEGESSSSGAGDVNLSRIWEGLARGFCMALTPHLPQLHADLQTHLALRATIHHQDVGYEAGSGGTRLSPACLNSLDSELVPVIHRAAASVTHDPIVLELFFHVLQQ